MFPNTGRYIKINISPSNALFFVFKHAKITKLEFSTFAPDYYVCDTPGVGKEEYNLQIQETYLSRNCTAILHDKEEQQ